MTRKNRITLVLLLVLLVCAAMWWGFRHMAAQPLPHAMSINTPVPAFQRPEFSSADLKGRVSVVNFFASWCPPCEIEHPELVRLKNEHSVVIYGINYKDSDTGRVDYLHRLGNPYTAVAPDPNGELAGQWMVHGIPETVIVDSNGYIRYRLNAPLTQDVVDRDILPLIRKLK